MTNLIEKYTDSELIIIAGPADYGEPTHFVGLQADFSWMPLSETYDNHGMRVEKLHCDDAAICPKDADGEPIACECEEIQIRAMNFWNGSNHQTIEIECAEYDVAYSEVTDETERADILAALRGAEAVRETTGIEYFTGGAWTIARSRWQGAWELYSLSPSAEWP